MTQPETSTYNVDLYAEAIGHPRFHSDISLQQDALEAIYASSASVIDARREAAQAILPTVNECLGFDPQYHRDVTASAVGDPFLGLNRPAKLAQALPFAAVRGIFRGAAILNSSRGENGTLRPELGIAIANPADQRQKYGFPLRDISFGGLLLAVPTYRKYGLLYDGGAYLRRQGARIRTILHGPVFAALSEKRRMNVIGTLLANMDDELIPEDDYTVQVECTKMSEIAVRHGRTDVNTYDGSPITLTGTSIEISLPEFDAYTAVAPRTDFPLSGGMPELVLRTIGDKRHFRIPLDACVGLEYEVESIDIQPTAESSGEIIQHPDLLTVLGKARMRCRTIIESADFRDSTAKVQRMAFDGLLDELNQKLDNLADTIDYPNTAVVCEAGKYRVIRTDQIGKVSYRKLPVFDQSDKPPKERQVLAGDAIFADIPELNYPWKNLFKSSKSFRFSGGEPVLVLHSPEKEAFYLILAKDVITLGQGAHADSNK